MKTRRNLIQNCLLCAAIIQLAAAAIPCRATTIADALDTPGLTYTTNSDLWWSNWAIDVVDSYYSHDGVDAVEFYMHYTGSCWIETTVTGPARISFWWRSEQYSRARFSVDGTETSSSGYYTWQQATNYLGAGTHVLRWTLQDYNMDPWYTPPYYRMYLDQVVLAAPTTPQILQQPQSLTRVQGDTAAFTATIFGADPMTYQWRLNSTNLPGATNLSLTITNVQATNAGAYSMVVSNSYGIGISSNAVLTVPATPFLYTTNNGSIMITGYIGSGGPVTIPDTLNGLPVTSIGSSAFQYKSLITSITIPNSVTSIGSGAFYSCAGLASLTIPTNVTSIGNSAFSACIGLTGLTIPTSVTNIGDYAFQTCTNLANVTLPNGITSIGNGTFQSCSSLINVTIPNSVTSIGSYPFKSCTSLAAITVAASNAVYSSLDGVLFNKSTSTLIQYPGGKAGSYSIPNGVTNIGDSAFYFCTSLNSVIIPNGVTSIASSAFYNCSSLSCVTIPNSVTNLGYDVFRFCYGLTSVTIGNSVSNIGSWAFHSCTNLKTACFLGNAPGSGSDTSVFLGDNNSIVYYLPGKTGWGTTFDGRPTALWLPQAQASDASFGVRTNQFGFNVNWASGQIIVVEASTSLSNPVWQPVQTNTLTGGTAYFSDPQWTNYPGRYYRLRSP